MGFEVTTEPCENPIGFLNEFSQKHKNEPVVSYAECASYVGGLFSIKCTFGHNEVVSSAHTKKEAKRFAANSMITLLNEENYFDKFRLDAAPTNNTICKNNDATPSSPVFSQTNNPISVLNEYSQSRGKGFPVYTQAHISGSGFVFQCEYDGKETHSYASTKKSAKAKAAFEMCKMLNLRFEGENDLPREKDDFQVGKNAIVALNEILAVSPLKAVYEVRPSIMNLFVIVCTVGGVSGEGRDTTKKGAKMSAANQVLQKLSIAKRTEILKSVKDEIFFPVVNFLVNTNIEPKEAMAIDVEAGQGALSIKGDAHFLKDFNLNSDEE